MRIASLSGILLAAALLGACVAPALVLPSASQLMFNLLKPLVGLDPNVVRLYDQPLVRNRMVALLGTHYDTARTLLETADTIQREGALFYVVSRFTPIPDIAAGAGLVWNGETNQMAVAILKGDGVQVFEEVVTRRVQAAEDAAVAAVTPTWPGVMQAWFAAGNTAGD
ncbi:MAG: hypothetical protein RLW62_03855 [Gammaproteobacteria bacterium]